MFGKKKDSKYPDNWPKIRKKVLRRDNHKCQECGSKKNLHVHHIKPISEGGGHEMRNLKAVCHSCHEDIHGFKIPGGKTPRNIDWFKYGYKNAGDYGDGSVEELKARFRRENCDSDEEYYSRLVGGVVGGAVLFSPAILSMVALGPAALTPAGFAASMLMMFLVLLFVGIPLAFISVICGGIAYLIARFMFKVYGKYL